MLTLTDCLALSDLDEEEMRLIAQHDRLPDIEAIAKGRVLLDHAWGAAALGQMARDELNACLRRGCDAEVRAALALLVHVREHHPPRADRRRAPRLVPGSEQSS